MPAFSPSGSRRRTARRSRSRSSVSLVAFRDSSGRVGILDEACPAPRGATGLRSLRVRAASLHLPRLKVDADGNLLEAPPERNQELFAGKIKRRPTRPARKLGSFTWAHGTP
ncbi:hypothetical protein HBB16_09660 [Pseudonocardia sp. MCCB 268]|nr:hypothetical protein [Pseudonocardia cytotoxica]